LFVSFLVKILSRRTYWKNEIGRSVVVRARGWGDRNGRKRWRRSWRIDWRLRKNDLGSSFKQISTEKLIVCLSCSKWLYYI
jgi:hypothetical protein